jgi:hypothetical protein
MNVVDYLQFSGAQNNGAAREHFSALVEIIQLLVHQVYYKKNQFDYVTM